MNAVLADIIRRKRRAVAQAKAHCPLAQLAQRIHAAPPVIPLAPALKRAGRVRLIAEIKRRSPSAGPLLNLRRLTPAADQYKRGGAAALSVLTEEHYFGGATSDIEDVLSVGLPVLRKDFTVDEYQIYETRAVGASAVLLIVALLTDKELRRFRERAEALGLSALVESHDGVELDRALSSGATLLGINSRNLKTLSRDAGVFERLIPQIPPGSVVVAESGIRTATDVRHLKSLGAHAIFVGESLLKQKNLAVAARRLVDASKGRRT